MSTATRNAILAAIGIALGLGPRAFAQVPDDQKSAPPKTPASIEMEDAVEFAMWLESAVSRNDRILLSRMCDWDRFIERLVKEYKLAPEAEKPVRVGLRKALDKTNGPIGVIASEVEKGGSVTLLRIRMREGVPHALFRQFTSEGGLNYQEILISKKENGSLYISDTYSVFAGGLFSQLEKRILLPIVVQLARKPPDELTEYEQDLLACKETLKKLTDARKAGEHKRVIELFDSLPRLVRQDSSLFLFKLLAAQAIDDESYPQAVDEFRKLFGDEPTADLLHMESCHARDEMDKIGPSLDRIEKWTGGDPFLLVMRAIMLQKQGKLSQARKAIDEAIEQEPTLYKSYEWGLTLALEAMEFERLLTLLKRVDETFEIEWENFSTLPDYAEFVKSPQYKQWLEYLERNAKCDDEMVEKRSGD